MTAIIARRRKLDVLLLDGQRKIGAKILMSGGTRCNITNDKVTVDDFNSENLRTVRNILSAFPSQRAIAFFKELDVELVLEPGGKYFPTTHSGKTILEALVREVERLGVRINPGHKVRGIRFNNGFEVSGLHEIPFHFLSRNVVLATGGLSYPTTGSDGVGYTIAKSFGHTLVETIPALTPLESDDQDLKNLSGVALDCILTLWINGKKDVSYQAPLLFTHFGFSGPSVLNISRHWIRAAGTRQITANFLPTQTTDKLRELILKTGQREPQKTLKKLLTAFWPERFAEVVLKNIDANEAATVNQCSKELREALIRRAFQYPLSVIKAVGYTKAEVTAGGVDFKEVDSKTLESKLQPGLFLAGEILDVDGRIGGFNFQWAWASGYVVGNAIK